MTTRADTIEFILGKTGDSVTARQMFGEYALYLDGKVVALVCDNQLFVKPTDAGRAQTPNAELAPPYPGAKEYLVIDDRQLGDARWLKSLLRVTADELPLPKPKKKKVAKKAVAKKTPAPKPPAKKEAKPH